MHDTITIRFPDGKTESCPRGSRIENWLIENNLMEHFGNLSAPLAALKVNNRILPLSARLETNAVFLPVTADTSEGVSIYRRSLAFLLAAAARECFSGRNLVIGHSLGNSYYYTFADSRLLADSEIELLSKTMRRLVDENVPISAEFISYTEAAELFEKNGQNDTLLLLERRSDSMVRINRLGDYANLYIGPLLPRTGILSVFELMAYEEGFLLRFPHTGKQEVGPFEDSPKIFSVFKEYKKWGRIVGVHAVGKLNHMVANTDRPGLHTHSRGVSGKKDLRHCRKNLGKKRKRQGNSHSRPFQLRKDHVGQAAFNRTHGEGNNTNSNKS